MADALLGNAALIAASMLALWVLAVIIGKASFIDAIWGFSMAGLALVSLRDLKLGGAPVLLAAMVAIWGLRLGLHLLRRYLRNGEDRRYREMLPDPSNRAAFAITTFWKVFLLQSVLIMLVSSPAQVGIIASDYDQQVQTWALPGLALYLLGVAFEWVGDWQLARFKADPANEGRVMDEGLWRFTRHPNYFGDACVWWGIWLVAMSIAPQAVVWTLPGPLFLTFTLVRWSGAGMTEAAMREKYGEEFADYASRTPAFIPWWPDERD